MVSSTRRAQQQVIPINAVDSACNILLPARISELSKKSTPVVRPAITVYSSVFSEGPPEGSRSAVITHGHIASAILEERSEPQQVALKLIQIRTTGDSIEAIARSPERTEDTSSIYPPSPTRRNFQIERCARLRPGG